MSGFGPADVYGAVAGSEEERRRTRTEADLARQEQALRERLFHESRGSAGNAFLPEYFGNFETGLSTDARNMYNAVRNASGTPEAQLAAGRTIQGRIQPIFDAGTGLISDLYSGNLENRRIAEAQPVAAARTAAAGTVRQGLRQAIAQRLNALSATDATRGYTGGGSASLNRVLRTQISGEQGAASAEAQAALENAQAEKAIRDQILGLQFSSLDIPYNRAQQAINLQQIPAELLTSNWQSALGPLRFFNIGPGQAPQTVRPPTPTAVPNAWQILANAAGGAENAAARYFLNRSTANAYNANDPWATQYGGSEGYFSSGAGAPAANVGYDYNPAPVFDVAPEVLA